MDTGVNKKRREKLRAAISLLDRAEALVNEACDQESGALDNYPENLQESERFEKMEDAVDSLNDALESIGEARDRIEAAIR